MKKFLFSVIGIISIILGVISFCGAETYGGDAYTGIQNAITFGFGALLVVVGLALAAYGITSEKKQDESKKLDEIETEISDVKASVKATQESLNVIVYNGVRVYK